MKKSDFYYDLDERLIAQHPIENRDSSRLMVIDRRTDHIEHRHFYEIVEYLHEGDVLVINDTKVLPARIYGKRDTGAVVEFLLLKRLSDTNWKVLVKPGKKAKIGDHFRFSNQLEASIVEIHEEGVREVSFQFSGIFEEILEEIGQMPIPPYIHEQLEDKNRYQTVYSKEPGSAAAPTAGLHFTNELLKKIEKKGVKIARVTLHVGLGTFRPVKSESIEDHHMHVEEYELTEENAQIIKKAKRVVAVGTTSVRTLESIYRDRGEIVATKSSTDIFMYPGFEFKVVDAMITNFHLPESTLVMLVSAFYERGKILEAYRLAAKMEYRFFSFGDAMFIYDSEE